MHSQDLGGTCDVALSVFQTARDVPPLKLAPVLTKVCCERDFQATTCAIITWFGDRPFCLSSLREIAGC
jgi:hypothetical protein